MRSTPWRRRCCGSPGSTPRTRRRSARRTTSPTSTGCSTPSTDRWAGEAVTIREFTLPDVGEGLTEAEIVSWRVQPGDTVAVNQVICEIETAKAAVELPSPWEGTVGKLLVEPGVTVEVGTPIITIDTGGGAAAQADDEAVPNLVGYGPRQGTATRRRRKGAAPPPQHDGRPQPAPTQLAPPAEPAPEPVGAVPLAKPPVRKLA